MQTTSTPRPQDKVRNRLETAPEPQQRETAPKTVDPEPHWELIIDAATD